MKAYFISGSATKELKDEKVPTGCTLVTIPFSSQKDFETLFGNSGKKQALLKPELQALKKELDLQDDDITIVKQGETYKNFEYGMFNVSNSIVQNSGLYELGVAKDSMDYKVKGQVVPLQEIEKSFDRAILPKNVSGRLASALEKKSEYTVKEIETVLNYWPFYEDVYKVCETVRDAVKKSDKAAAKTALAALGKNLQSVEDSRNGGKEWTTAIIRFRNDVEDVLKKEKLSEKEKEIVEKSYVENIESRENEHRRGGVRASYIFKNYPGVLYAFRSELSDDPSPSNGNNFEEIEEEEKDDKKDEEEEEEKEEEEKEDEEKGDEEEEEEKDGENEQEENDTKEESTASEAIDGKPNVTTVLIKISNQTFSLDKGIPAYARRAGYFLNNEGNLTKDEQAILNAVGINKEIEQRLKAYLPSFFDALPDCQTDTSLYLSKSCEIPYFVVWSTKFAERQQTQERIKENEVLVKPVSDYDTVIHEAVIEDMKAKYSDIDALFTIIRLKTAPVKVDDSAIEKLFTLMLTSKNEKTFQIDDLFVLIINK